MQLYDEIEETRARAGPWLVAALEASPLIAPHVARCAAALTEGLPLPESPVPPTGSSDHLYRFVRDHPTLRQCWRRTHQEFNREGKACVMQHPEVVANMSRLAADPFLATRAAVHDAMSQTSACPGAPARCHKLRALLNNDTNFRGRVYEEQPACTFQSNRTGCWRCGMNCGRRRRR